MIPIIYSIFEFEININFNRVNTILITIQFIAFKRRLVPDLITINNYYYSTQKLRLLYPVFARY